ncbi:MAG: glycosyltransferase family 39 protein, partial [Planctomycetales bacterium]|nr:glycosyltransferase family 39 protein [Planctomycetales bacterium]
AWEMFERGDWVVPTFNGELRTHKPILLYWVMMSAYHVGGVNEWTARAGSALLSVGTVLLTYGVGRRILPGNGGMWAAVVLSTTLMFNVAAHAATPDACLIFCCTAALFSLVYGSNLRCDADDATATTESNWSTWPGRVHPGWALVAFVAMGLAVLAKGPVGFVLPLAVWGVFTWWTAPHKESADATSASLLAQLANKLHPHRIAQSLLVIRPITAVIVVLVIAAPWYYLVGQRTDGVWLREFFLEHNVGRAMRAMEGHRGNPLLYYPIAMLVGFFPWSVFAVPLAIWTWRRRDANRLPHSHVFLLCWIGVIVTAFSFASTKLPSYVTPTYPAIALLCGDLLATWETRRQSLAAAWPQRAALTLALIGCIIIIGLPVAAHFVLPGEAWLGIIGLIPAIGGTLMWKHLRAERFDAGFRVAGGTAILLSLAIWGLVVPQVSRHQEISKLLERTRHEQSDSPIASLGVHEPSWIFYAGRTIPLLDPTETQVAAEILNQPGGQLIVSRSMYEQSLQQLPVDVSVRKAVPYFLKDEQLLLLERNDRATITHRSTSSDAPFEAMR